MTSNSLDSLLAWMRNPQNNVMWGWDAIVAMDRNKTNTLLLQEYIARFNSNSYLPPISGEVEMVAGEWQEHIHDFILDAPRLSFENASIDDSKARLTCSVMGGVQVTMQHDLDFWKATKVVEIDPLQGPKLMLDLHLGRVPGNVDRDGRVMLDLKDSDNFVLTFAETAHERELGGSFFKDLFNTLPAEKRIWVMGELEAGIEPMLRPQSFRLRTHANPQASADPGASSYGDGAVMIFICLEGSSEGGGVSTDYPYLIPDDASGNYSATVLFERERCSAGIMLGAVAQLIQSHDFSYEYDINGKLLSATALGGAIHAPAVEFVIPFIPDFPALPQVGRAFMDELVFLADSESPLKITVSGDEFQVSWKTSAIQNVRLEYPFLESFVSSCKCDLTLSAKYELIETANEGVWLLQKEYLLTHEIEEIESATSMDRNSDPDLINEFIRIVMLYVINTIIAVSILTADILLRIEIAFGVRFSVSTSMDKFLKDHIKLSFNQAIQGDAIRAPRDIGFFGRVSPTQTSFVVNPLQPLMAAGGRQLFSTSPSALVSWSVEPLPGESGDIGTISDFGVYTAPAASAIVGRFTRVRVTATRGADKSSALVTVLVNELTINPLIQLCDFSHSVELAAGALRAGGLNWAIKNPVAGESGTVAPSPLPDGDHRYTAGPKVAGKTYVLDEIELTHSSGAKRSAWMLVRQKQSLLTVKPREEAGLPLRPGELQLDAIFNEEVWAADWTLPTGGPGTIDSEGIYRSDPNATERFVLIFASAAFSPTNKLEGHIILPLPLDTFPEELTLMAI